MKVTFAIVSLAICCFTYAQDWEISVAPGGLSNYENWFEDRQVHIKDYQYSFFVSGFKKFEKKMPKKERKAQWHQGVGFSYSYHQAHWIYAKNNGHFAPSTSSIYDFAMGVVSGEFTPIICEFKNGFEIRSGLLIGAIVHADASFNLSRFRRFNLQLANRFSWEIRTKRFNFSPFYQFSHGLINGITSGQIRRLFLHRHNVGVTFEIGTGKD